MKKTNLFTISTTAWKEEDFILLTTLSEAEVTDVIRPIVQDERDGKGEYDNDFLVSELQKRYPKEIVEMYTIDTMDSIDI